MGVQGPGYYSNSTASSIIMPWAFPFAFKVEYVKGLEGLFFEALTGPAEWDATER